MNNIFNRDFLELIACFNKHEVKYVLVGGYSVILHGYPRTTGDLDLLVERTQVNYQSIVEAFQCFMLPTFSMTLENFLDVDQFDVFRFGRPPVAVDVITEIKGVDFDKVWEGKISSNFEGVQVNYISLEDLITTKKAVGRSKDLNDLDNLSS